MANVIGIMFSGSISTTFAGTTSDVVVGGVPFSGTITTLTALPPAIVPIGVGISKLTIGNPPNKNTVVGTVSVTTADGRFYPGQLILGGTNATKFVLSNGGFLPCNLVVGPVDIAAGNYNITLTAN